MKFNQSIRVGRDLHIAGGKGAVRFRHPSASGLHASRKLGMPGSNHPQVYDGVQLLEKILLAGFPGFRGRLCVIGPGNTAVDVAAPLLR